MAEAAACRTFPFGAPGLRRVVLEAARIRHVLRPLHFNYSKRSSPSQRRPKERFHAANEDGRTAHESGVPGGSTNERGALMVPAGPLQLAAAVDGDGRLWIGLAAHHIC